MTATDNINIASFPRSSVVTPPQMLCVPHRWSGAACIPTPERGNDKSHALTAYVPMDSIPANASSLCCDARGY